MGLVQRFNIIAWPIPLGSTDNHPCDPGIKRVKERRGFEIWKHREKRPSSSKGSEAFLTTQCRAMANSLPEKKPVSLFPPLAPLRLLQCFPHPFSRRSPSPSGPWPTSRSEGPSARESSARSTWLERRTSDLLLSLSSIFQKLGYFDFVSQFLGVSNV